MSKREEAFQGFFFFAHKKKEPQQAPKKITTPLSFHQV